MLQYMYTCRRGVHTFRVQQHICVAFKRILHSQTTWFSELVYIIVIINGNWIFTHHACVCGFAHI